nr:hypothetical protein [Bacteroidota bacterium]
MNCCKAQGLNNLWMHGYSDWGGIPYGGTNINLYSGDTNIYYHSRSLPLNFAHSNITDSSGNLLFYTNGISIFSWNDSLMQNGYNISLFSNPQWLQYGSPVQESTIILPYIGDTNKYYLIHEAYRIIIYRVPPIVYP